MPNTKINLDALERALTGSAMGLTFRECQSLIKYARELEAENLELCGVAQAADAQRRELESASQPGGGEAAAVVCISAKELLDVLELAAPDVMPEIDRDHEQMDTEMCIGRLTGSLDDDGADTGPGLFAWYTEYPEEGVIPLRLDRDVRASIDALRAAPPFPADGAD